jgi:hypothetical protein
LSRPIRVYGRCRGNQGEIARFTPLPDASH